MVLLCVCVQNQDEMGALLFYYGTYKGTPKCTFQLEKKKVQTYKKWTWKIILKQSYGKKNTNVYETNTDRNGDNLTENCTRAHIDLCSCSSSLYLCVKVSAVSATAAVNLIVLILWKGIMQIIVKWRYMKDARFAPHTKRAQASSLAVPWL